ncbi:hypothetical protein ACFSWD_19485 [Paenibacillus xanthanilyticus]
MNTRKKHLIADVEGQIDVGTAENSLTEETKAKLMDKYGFTESEPLKDTLFQGDIGFTINFPILITSTILIVVPGFLLYFFLKKRKL